MKRDNKKSCKGSMTVEMCFIFPLVFALIIFIFFIAIMLYNRSVANSLADKNLDKAAIFWVKSNLDFDTGAYTAPASDDALYSELYDAESDNKKQEIDSHLKNDISKFVLADNITITPKIDTKNYFVYRKLEAEVTIDYGVPFGGILKIIGLGKPIKDTVKIDAVINDPVEFTRNINFLGDMIGELRFRNEKVNNALNGVDALNAKLDDLLSKFEEFVKPK